MDDPTFLDVAALQAAFQRRSLSPLELMEACLERIDDVNPELNAYVTVDREGALAGARAATAALRGGAELAPLHGVPVGIKDLTDTAGMRTTYGSTIHADHVPDADALVVERLRAAGAIVVGKTNTPEFGAGGNTFNEVFGATRNPWNPALTCGGSSGGSAVAVATGMSTLCEGSDLGGSLRTPASFCGVVGFRTTPGLVPSWPVRDAWNSLSVTGPIGRTVADVALMLSVVAGPDDRAPLSYAVDAGAFVRAAAAASIDGWRVAFSPDLGGVLPVDPEVAEICAAAMDELRRLGASVTTASPDFGDVRRIVLATRGLSMAMAHADHIERDRRRMQPGLVWNVDQGLALAPAEIGAGIAARTELWERVRAFMERYELLACPTVAVPPFPVEQPYPTAIAGVPLADYTQWFFLTYAITLTGLPALSVPCGFTRAGVPVGLQLVGRRRREADVLCAAAAYERAAGWVDRRPPAAGSLRFRHGPA